MNQFAHNCYIEQYDPTESYDFRKQVMLDGKACLIDLLDTAGQDEYTALREHWIKAGQAFVLVYSITSKGSLSSIEQQFFPQIVRIKEQQRRQREQEPGVDTGGDCSQPSKPIVVLIGNKSDLESHRDVSYDEGAAVAKRLGCPFFETSAKLDTNVVESLFELVRLFRREAETEKLNERQRKNENPTADRKGQQQLRSILRRGIDRLLGGKRTSK